MLLRYQNKSQHRKFTMEKKILPPHQPGLNPRPFDYESGALPLSCPVSPIPTILLTPFCPDSITMATCAWLQASSCHREVPGKAIFPHLHSVKNKKTTTVTEKCTETARNFLRSKGNNSAYIQRERRSWYPLTGQVTCHSCAHLLAGREHQMMWWRSDIISVLGKNGTVRQFPGSFLLRFNKAQNPLDINIDETTE